MNTTTAIAKNQLDILIEKHRKYLLKKDGGEQLKLEGIIIDGYDFSGKDCENAQFINCTFKYDNTAHQGIDDEGDTITFSPNGEYSFKNTNFSHTDFTGSKFEGRIDLGQTLLNDAIFINVDWTWLGLTNHQKGQIITTVSQLTAKVINQKIVIDKKDEQIQEKDETLKKTSEKQSKGMLDIFDELRVNFIREEILWMIFSACIFLTIFTIAETIVAFLNPGLATIILGGVVGGIVFIGIILTWIDNTNIKTKKFEWSGKNIGKSILETFAILGISLGSVTLINSSIDKWNSIICKTTDINSCISMEKAEFAMIPITFILLSLLWFSVHQYGRAKKLRIEQQNKQAMIHFMQAVIAQDGKGSYAERSFPQLAPFFANAIIHRPFSQENYEPQLPIDEVKKIVDMAKLFQK